MSGLASIEECVTLNELMDKLTPVEQSTVDSLIRLKKPRWLAVTQTLSTPSVALGYGIVWTIGPGSEHETVKEFQAHCKNDFMRFRALVTLGEGV